MHNAGSMVVVITSSELLGAVKVFFSPLWYDLLLQFPYVFTSALWVLSRSGLSAISTTLAPMCCLYRDLFKVLFLVMTYV